MSGKRKPSAREAFDDNIADAEYLVSLARALLNRRSRRMRRELRERLGEALDLPKRSWAELDCIESEDLFAVLPAGSRLTREHFQEAALGPLLRQALVAACAALETFVGDRVMERLRGALDEEERPGRLLALPMTVGDWLYIDETYQRRRWGLREIVEIEVRQIASPDPAQIGKALGIVGEKSIWRRIDAERRVRKGSSEASLRRIYERRNRIAHQGDRDGRGRANIMIDEVDGDLVELKSIVAALDGVTGA